MSESQGAGAQTDSDKMAQLLWATPDPWRFKDTEARMRWYYGQVGGSDPLDPVVTEVRMRLLGTEGFTSASPFLRSDTVLREHLFLGMRLKYLWGTVEFPLRVG